MPAALPWTTAGASVRGCSRRRPQYCWAQQVCGRRAPKRPVSGPAEARQTADLEPAAGAQRAAGQTGPGARAGRRPARPRVRGRPASPNQSRRRRDAGASSRRKGSAV
eukprot:scaffold7429_cov123-Isochrysis_galbana.AAC.3